MGAGQALGVKTGLWACGDGGQDRVWELAGRTEFGIELGRMTELETELAGMTEELGAGLVGRSWLLGTYVFSVLDAGP